MLNKYWKAALSGIGLVALNAPAFAQSRAMSTIWTILPATELPGERFIASNEWVIQQRLLPEGLFRLEGAASVAGGLPLLQAGTQLIEIRAEGATIACDAVARRQKLVGASQFCLVDYDKDGAFDGIFPVANISKGGGLPTVQGAYPKKAKVIEPVAYSRIDPSQIESSYFVGIRNAGKATIYDWQNFQVCYGSGSKTDCLSAYSRTSASIFPQSFNALGAQVTVLAREDGKVRVRVDSAMPSQPFGIISTTTYRIQ